MPAAERELAGASRWRARCFAGEDGDPAALAREVLALEPLEWLRRVPGRATAVTRFRGDLAVVKRFTGDALRERLYEARRGRRRSPARREAESLADLRAAGIDVPRPLAWAEDGRGASALVMEHIPHGEDLAERLARCSPEERAAELERLAAVVGRLHRAGFYHRDLYLCHFAPRADGSGLVLFDAGRVRREERPRRRWLEKDLAALLLPSAARLTDAETLRLLERWCALSLRVDPRGLPRLARRLARRAARMAAHVPRHLDPQTRRPSIAR